MGVGGGTSDRKEVTWANMSTLKAPYHDLYQPCASPVLAGADSKKIFLKNENIFEKNENILPVAAGTP